MSPSAREALIGDTVKGLFVFTLVIVIGVALFNVYGEKEKRSEQLEKLAPPIPWDIWKTNPLPDGTFETFRKVQYGGTLVHCYSVIEPKSNKTRFSSCTFTPNQKAKEDNR